MLKLLVQSIEFFDSKSQEFMSLPEVTLELEHSLVSLSKWESSFEKPFLSQQDKTHEEVLAYIKMMTLTPDVDDEVYSRLTAEHFNQINKYINAKMTATWFSNDSAKGPREVVTSEIIYYWMITFKIPFECETWHLNRLFTLIRVCGNKSTPAKKMSRSAIAARNRELNAQRRAAHKTSG